MNKFKLFLKSIRFSFELVYCSSGLWIILYLFLSISAAVLSLFSTYSLKFILDELTVKNDGSSNIFLCIVAYFIILLLIQATTSIQNILYDSIFKKASHFYECKVAKKLSLLPLSVVDSSKGKDMVEDVRYSQDTAVYLAYRIIRIFSCAYTFIAALIPLVVFNVGFTLLLLFLTIPGAVLLLLYDKKSEDLRQKQAPDVRKFCYYRWMLTDLWPAKDVRMYDLTESIKKRYDDVKNEYIHANKLLDKKKLQSMILAEIILRCGEIVFTIFVVWKAVRGDISLGDVTLYIGLALAVTNSFDGFINISLLTYYRATDVMARVFDFFSIQTEHKFPKRKLQNFESIEFQDVCFKYPYTDNYILRGVSFVLNRGDKLSIVGVNGSGKSTIIKLMIGLYEVESGEILLNGYPISEYNIQDVRKLFSVLFQTFVQYPLTLRENVALSDYERVNEDDAIISALKKSDAYKEIQNQLETKDGNLDFNMTRQFDDQGFELSKGQWQKVALSRVYFKDTPIFIFDEPSASLDAEAEDKIFENFSNLSSGKTGIMISHRISATRRCSQIIVLENGIIVENGTHEQLMTRGGVYAKLYNLQKEKYVTKEDVK